ncbi:MAG: GNAT family N-acetyltransferase [Chthoniobacter sp.]|uniref:GNAT family N-acetyltransferase n=1 Tax=Chthoniobacter sp. TaxID=2510640 RepID=UPI0032A2C661
MPDALITSRTLLRPFTLEDAPAAFPWFSDPEVMHFIPGGPDQTLAAVETRLARYIAHQQLHGFSKWLVIDRATQENIGDAGLFYFPDGVRIELGFRLRRDRWGKGYAPEVAAAWIAHYQQHHPGRTLHAITEPENHRSQRVLARLGFKTVGSEVLYDEQFDVFALAPASSATQ